MMNDKHYTQIGLKAFGLYDKGIDGIHGKGTTEGKLKMISELKSLFIKKGYIWEDDYNLIGIRMDDIYTNKFTDWGIITIGSTDLIMFPMSTKPGIGRVKNPPTVAGKKGVAVLKEGQHDCYSHQGAWWSGDTFLLQVKPVVIYRDYNLDNIISREVEQSDADLPYKFSINFHTWKNTVTGWSWDLDVISYFVKGRWSNLSEGCQVVQSKIMSYVKNYFKLLVNPNKLITYTLLHKTDFE